ncbi:MAG: hypothetical protein WCO26_20315, partial [Deltaproteobacteria bacterium]
FTLSLDGGEGSFRVWTTSSPASTNTPLLVGGQTVTNGVNGAEFAANPGCDLYIEALSNSTATLTYTFTGTGCVTSVSCAAPLKMTAFKISIDPPGRVAFAGATTNVAFCVTPGSWSDCIWTISFGTALFADGPDTVGYSQYWYGTNVWVSPGALATNYSITCSVVDVPSCQAKAGLVVSREISWTPGGDKIYVWQPINDEFNFYNTFINYLSLSENYQGWSCSATNPVTRFFDSDSTDDDFERCTLDNLKAVVNGGILFIQTHGQTGMLEVARCATEAAANAWIGAEPNIGAVAGPSSNFWSVIATSAWFSNNWKPISDQHKAIVFLEACHGADGYASIASSVGGKTVFATHGEPSGSVSDEAFQSIVEVMNGNDTIHAQNGRSALNAFNSINNNNLLGIIEMSGDGLSTLCPAPQRVFPSSPEEVNARWGCILFDTYMDISVSANIAVISTAGIIDSRSWKGNETGYYYIDFIHSGASTAVEASGDKCKSVGGSPLEGSAKAPMSPVTGEPKEWGW